MIINKIINADCMDIMKDIPDKYFELAIVDPPYGIFGFKSDNFDFLKGGTGGTWASKYGKQTKRWDVKPDDLYFDELKRISKEQIIFGANHFGFPFDNYLVWKKLTISESFSMGMCELASVSIRGNPKVFTLAPQDTHRFHPTQKPLNLYRKIIMTYAKTGNKIIDTHSGSGSCAIACYLEKYEFLAIEKDKEYFDMSIKRFEEVKSQGILF